MKKLLITIGIWLFAFSADASISHYSDFESWDWSRPYYVSEDYGIRDGFDYVKYLYDDPERNVRDIEICRDFERHKGKFPDVIGKLSVIESCLMQEATFNLNGGQISDMLGPYFDIYHVVDYIYPHDETKTPISTQYVFEWSIRMYNMVTKNNWPECPYETGEHIDSAVNEPCNEYGETLKSCLKGKKNITIGSLKEKDELIICMQEKLLTKFAEYILPDEEIYGKKEISYSTAVRYINTMFQLLGETYGSISAVVPEPRERLKELLRMYNFYDLMLDQAFHLFEEDFKANKTK